MLYMTGFLPSKLRENSFASVAPLLYNLLPSYMRRVYFENDPFFYFYLSSTQLLRRERLFDCSNGLSDLII